MDTLVIINKNLQNSSITVLFGKLDSLIPLHQAIFERIDGDVVSKVLKMLAFIAFDHATQ